MADQFFETFQTQVEGSIPPVDEEPMKKIGLWQRFLSVFKNTSITNSAKRLGR
jgi:hypothetical protein